MEPMISRSFRDSRRSWTRNTKPKRITRSPMNLAPTISDSMDIPIPTDMDGKLFLNKNLEGNLELPSTHTVFVDNGRPCRTLFYFF